MAARPQSAPRAHLLRREGAAAARARPGRSDGEAAQGHAVRRAQPGEQVPVLVLDDGTPLSETVAICRYIEALNPAAAAVRHRRETSGLVEMWNRRLEFGLYIAIQAVFRHGHPGMAAMEQPQIADWAEVNRPRGRAASAPARCAARRKPLRGGRLVHHRRHHRRHLRRSDQACQTRDPEELTHLRRWHEGLRARPSWGA